MADVYTGTSSTLRVLASEVSPNPGANTSGVAWELWFIERVSAPATHHDTADISASVVVDGSTVWSGAFAFDWRPAGFQSLLIASGTTTVTHDPDGSAAVDVTGSIGSTATSGGGGPASVTQHLSLTTLTVVPGTPTSVTAVRNSDTQVTVSWSESSASNGQPVSNTVRRKINGGAFADAVTISPALSTTLAAAANQKLVYGVKGTNGAGDSAWSADSAPIYTTPAAPSGVSASKNASLDIVVTWTDNVGFAEHKHTITPQSSTDGGGTWSSGSAVDVAAGTTSKTFTTPDAAKLWRYQIAAVNTATGALTSTAVISNTVQLLAAPNKPTLPTLPVNVDKGKAFAPTWAHNPVDTTPQTAYEFGYSTNGGTSWSTTGKVTSTTSSKSFAANTYAAEVALTVRVRTWGQATSGGSDGTGASPWSDPQTVTFKTRPVVTITSPADAGTWTQADLAVELGFSQAEAATFVRATIVLNDGSTDVETVDSTTLASTALETQVQDGGAYTVTVTVLDSNGLVSDPVDSSFSVAYTLPVQAGLTITYLRESGRAQLDLTVADPAVGEAAAVEVNIYRTIDGIRETITTGYPTAAAFAILDITPTIHGDNFYEIVTISEDGAHATVSQTLTTSEDKWAFLTRGEEVVSFFANLSPGVAPGIETALVATAGREKPIAQFGENTSHNIDVTATLFAGEGSTWQQIDEFLRKPGLVCYRDPAGQRMFGAASGSLPALGPIATEFRLRIAEAT